MANLITEIESQIKGLKIKAQKQNVGVVIEIGDGVAKIEGLSDVQRALRRSVYSGAYSVRRGRQRTPRSRDRGGPGPGPHHPGHQDAREGRSDRGAAGAEDAERDGDRGSRGCRVGGKDRGLRYRDGECRTLRGFVHFLERDSRVTEFCLFIDGKYRRIGEEVGDEMNLEGEVKMRTVESIRREEETVENLLHIYKVLNCSLAGERSSARLMNL